jgi:site-specific DNA-methyltransferase (adenine-specific)
MTLSLLHRLSAPPSPRWGAGPAPAVTLECGDCLAGMRARSGATVDVVVTSPPYNLGVAYEGSAPDNRPEPEYCAWVATWTRQIYRLLKPGGSYFLNFGYRPSDPGRIFRLYPFLAGAFQLQNQIHWVKSIAVPQEKETLACGHYQPVNSPRFLNQCHEYLFHFTKGGDVPLDRLAIGVPYQDPSNQKRWQAGGRGVRCPGNCWFVAYETISCRATQRPHPATFPVALARRCLQLHGAGPGTTVLDPFTGIGSTGVAAVERGCDFLGYELGRPYFEEARLRIHEALATRGRGRE